MRERRKIGAWRGRGSSGVVARLRTDEVGRSTAAAGFTGAPATRLAGAPLRHALWRPPPPLSASDAADLNGPRRATTPLDPHDSGHSAGRSSVQSRALGGRRRTIRHASRSRDRPVFERRAAGELGQALDDAEASVTGARRGPASEPRDVPTLWTHRDAYLRRGARAGWLGRSVPATAGLPPHRRLRRGATDSAVTAR